jgi:hypothetical protein
MRVLGLRNFNTSTYEFSPLLGYDAVSRGNSFTAFRGNVVVPSSRVEVCKALPSGAASSHKRGKLSYVAVETWTSLHANVACYVCRNALHLLQRRPTVYSGPSAMRKYRSWMVLPSPSVSATRWVHLAYVLPTCRSEMHRGACAFLFYSVTSTCVYGESVSDGSHFQSWWERIDVTAVLTFISWSIVRRRLTPELFLNNVQNTFPVSK